jgi:hypothetical protein
VFGQANAEPMIGPTRPAGSRTTLKLSPGAALALLASRAPHRMMAPRGFKHEFRAKAGSNHRLGISLFPLFSIFYCCSQRSGH